MIDNKDLLQIVTEQDHKFEYHFTTLCFAILGLSIQFSPSYGKTWPELLVFAWTFLLLSAILAGYRIVYRIVALKINYQVNNNEQYRTHALKILNAVDNNPLQNVLRPDGTDLPAEELKTKLAESEQNIKTGDESFRKIASRLSFLYWIQMATFFLGIVANLIFVSKNFLVK